jgi:hypothetical protein
MGKKKSRKKGGRRGGDIIRYPFKFTYQPLSTQSNGFSGTYLDLSCANLGTRISVVCKQFRRWRFVRSLKVMQYMDTVGMASISYDVAAEEINAVNLSHAVGFFGGPETSLSAVPSNMNTIVELVCSKIGPSSRVLNLTVPLSYLKEAMIEPWHFTTDGGALPFADATIIGNLQFGLSLGVNLGTGYANVYVVISGEIEFSEPIEPAISMNSWKPQVSKVLNVPNPSLILLKKRCLHCGYESLVHGAHSCQVNGLIWGSPVDADEKSGPALDLESVKTEHNSTGSATEFVMMPDKSVGRVSPVQTAMILLPDKIVADTGRNGDGLRPREAVIIQTKRKSDIVAVERKDPP